MELETQDLSTNFLMPPTPQDTSRHRLQTCLPGRQEGDQGNHMPGLSHRAELAFPGKRKPTKNREILSYFLDRLLGFEKYGRVPRGTFLPSLHRGWRYSPRLCVLLYRSTRGQQLLAAQSSCARVWTRVAPRLPSQRNGPADSGQQR